MTGLPLKRVYEREPIDFDEADIRAAFAASDAAPLGTRIRAQISRSLDRCVRLRRTLQSSRMDQAQLARILKVEQQTLALMRSWTTGERPG